MKDDENVLRVRRLLSLLLFPLSSISLRTSAPPHVRLQLNGSVLTLRRYKASPLNRRRPLITSFPGSSRADAEEQRGRQTRFIAG